MSVLEVRSISKVYRSGAETNVGLNDVSFTVKSNEFVAIVGPNGAGKTTTIKIIATLTKPTTGNVRIFGQNIALETKVIRESIGYTGQDTSTDIYASTYENLLHHGNIYGLTRQKSRQRALSLIEQFDLVGQSSMEVRRLSGGQRRRLDIALSLVHEPKILILDEPSANLDPDSRRRLWRILTELKENNGLTLIFTTHDLHEADKYADRLLFIDKGRCITSGTPDELKDELGGESLVLQFDDTVASTRAANRLREKDSFMNSIVAYDRVISPSSSVFHINEMLSYLSDLGMSPQSITLSRPSLDDVYIRLTGEAFDKADIEGQTRRNKTKEFY